MLLNRLARGCKARTLLEIGTSYGYSTLWLAEAARQTGGTLISLDLAGRESITFYDPSYLWLATHLQAELVTQDERLRARASRAS